MASIIDTLKDTDLWQVLERKARGEGCSHEFLAEVENFCRDALNLSKTTIRFFPTFTLHDGTHSINVCEWMYFLLEEEWANQLTAQEAALLIMAACSHDLGMAVNAEQEENIRTKLRENIRSQSSQDYMQYCLENPEDLECWGKRKVTAGMLHNYIRRHHHESWLIHQIITSSFTNTSLNNCMFSLDLLLKLCESHGKDLSLDDLDDSTYDLLFFAVLLRLADLLDYDGQRAPNVIFKVMGLDEPHTIEEIKSNYEFRKNSSGGFLKQRERGDILYHAKVSDPNLDIELRKYMDWVNDELNTCHSKLHRLHDKWKNFTLPRKVQCKIETVGYSSGDFCMTMDQDRVIQLFAGKDLYCEPIIFIRELLQNSIDAIRIRDLVDSEFNLSKGRIEIDSWKEHDDTWFRIRDNGIGMDEQIIKNYFLKIGSSYYNSDEFRYIKDHARKNKAYVPISRFGIGILSCFVEDPKGTELHVSTTRYNQIGRGIRLDVKGVHGFYYLTKESDRTIAGKPMPGRNGASTCYRNDVGTTICVRLNLDRAGCTKSIQEILDQYVKFPEVRVTYKDPNRNKKIYPTQAELCNLLKKTNSLSMKDRVAHPLPDEDFQRLKKHFYEFEWEKRPEIILQYSPLGSRSGSADLIGIEWSAKVDFAAKHKDYKIHGECELRNRTTLYVRFSTNAFDPFELSIDLNSEDSPLGKDERKLLEHLLSTGLLKSGEHHLLAYNGVLASETHRPSSRKYSLTLLRGSFRPEVRMDRTSIWGLPPEAACCYAVTFGDEITFDPVFLANSKTLRLLSRNEINEYLAKYPTWENQLKQSQADLTRNDELFCYYKTLYMRILFSYLEKTHKWSADFDSYGVTVRAVASTDVSPDADTDDFPAMMFLAPERPSKKIAGSYSGGYVYNREHEFCQWLIRNRDILKAYAPTHFNRMVQIMVCADNKKSICAGVNAILSRIRNLHIPGLEPKDIPTDLTKSMFS